MIDKLKVVGGKVISKAAMMLFALSVFYITTEAQNNVGIGTTTPDQTAVLDVSSTDKGMLVPRLTDAQVLAISNPANGLMVYNTTDSCIWIYNSAEWVSLCRIIVDLQGTTNDVITMITGNMDYANIDTTYGTYIDVQRLDGDSIWVTYLNATDVDMINVTIQNLNANLVVNDSGWYNYLSINGYEITHIQDTINNMSAILSSLTDTIGSYWNRNGNAGTTPATHYVGTSDGTDLSIRTNGNERVLLDGNLQKVGFGMSGNAMADTVAYQFHGSSTNGNTMVAITAGSSYDALTDGAILNHVPGVAFYIDQKAANTPIIIGAQGGEALRIEMDNKVKIGGGAAAASNLHVDGGVAFTGINEGTDSILVSDANGAATWKSIYSVQNLSDTIAALWTRKGNAGTSDLVDFAGTSDAQDFVLKADNKERIRMFTNGNIGFNLNGNDIINNGSNFEFHSEAGSFQAQLDISAGPFYGSSASANSLELLHNMIGDDFIRSRSTTQALGLVVGDYEAIRLSPQGSITFMARSAGLGTGAAWDGSIFTQGSHMAYSANSGALRIGNVSSGKYGTNFSDANTGDYSFGYGNDVLASGNYAWAVGNLTEIKSDYTFGFGRSILVESGSDNIVTGQNITVTTNLSNSVVMTDGNALTLGTITNEFISGFSGGYTLYSDAAHTTGVTLAAGSGTWASVSDRNMKTNIVALDYGDVLSRIKSLEISKWSYKTQTSASKLYDKDIYHVGVMAQDFYQAFGLGTSENKVTALDVAGVNTAAIKELINLVENQQAQIETLEKKIEDLSK